MQKLRIRERMTALSGEELRRGIHVFFIVFISVVLLSFGYGLHLMRTGRATSAAFDPSAGLEADVARLIESAERHLEEERVEQALMAYRNALAEAPGSIEAQLGVARAELLAGREAVAAREYERALALEVDNRTALLELWRLYAHERLTWDRSEVRFREYLRLNPADHGAALELARILAWNHKSDAAVEIFARPEVRPLMTAEDWKGYAFALVRSGRDTQAEAVLRDLVAARPSDLELKVQLAALYVARQDWASAGPLYEALLQERPDDPDLHLAYGLSLLSTGRYRDALGPLRTARDRMPSNGEAGLAYARALKGSGDLDRAVDAFTQALPQYRSDAGIVREYADLRLEHRDYRSAEQFYKNAAGLGLRDTRLLVGLAGALRGSGKHREALPYLEEAYARQPTDRLAFELAAVLHETGQNDRALALLDRIEAN